MATTRTTKTSAKKTARTAKKAVKQAAKKTARKSATTESVAKRRVAAKKRVVTKKRVDAKKRVTTKSRPASRSAGDAIAVLKQDHREVEAAFKRFERAGGQAYRAKRDLVDSMIEMLSRHAAIEELVFYPTVRAEVARAGSDVLEALEEHHVVKWLLHELEDLDPRAERFDAKVTVLMESVRHHVREEEGELFPAVRKGMAARRLRELGDELRDAKPRVPTRPHPGAPDEPPGNVLMNGAATVVDRARSAGKRAIDRVREEIPTP